MAIATALMPPICTAGFGLATLQFNFFFGALYLFAINTVFIGVASLFVCQFLQFPIRAIVDSVRRKRINQYITLILTITIVPSVYFGYLLVQNEKLSKDSREKIKTKALAFQIDTSKIVINSGANLSILDQSKQRYESEKDILAKQLNVTEFMLQKSEKKLDSIQQLPAMGNMILQEIRPLYSQISSCSYTESYIYSDSVKSAKVPIVILFTKKASKLSLNKTDKQKIEDWLKIKLKNKNVKALFEEEV